MKPYSLGSLQKFDRIQENPNFIFDIFTEKM